MSDWDCPAYGAGGREVGAICFFGLEAGHRDCADEPQCRSRLAAERRRVFARIQERAAAGDPDMEFLAEVFTHPEQLLGGPDSAP